MATATSAIAVPVATGPKLTRVDNQAPVLRPLAPLPGDRPEPSPTSAPPQLARPAVAVTFGRLPATPADNTTPVTGAAHPAFSSVASPAEADAHADDTWVVEPGDHLWSIAEAVTRRRQHGPVTQAMISRYWRAMITANRTSIVDPDVIQPGDRVQLPPNTLDR